VIFYATRDVAALYVLRRAAPLLISAIRTLTPKALGQTMVETSAYATQQVDRRLALQSSRPDYIDAMLNAGSGSHDSILDLDTSLDFDIPPLEKGPSQANSKQKPISYSKIVSNARFLVLAGSETTATALAATAFLLATHPDTQRKLAAEVRSAFKTE